MQIPYGKDLDGGYSFDGKYHLVLSNYTNAVAYNENGDQVSQTDGVSPLEDANGNLGWTLAPTPPECVAANQLSQDCADMQFPAGRTVVKIRSVKNGATYLNTQQTLSVLNETGGFDDYIINYRLINVYTAFQSGAPSGVAVIGRDYEGQTQIIDNILLPDKQAYRFTYDEGDSPGHYGTISTATLPTGATITYAFAAVTPGAPGSNTVERYLRATSVSSNTGLGSTTIAYSWTPGFQEGVPVHTVTFAASNDSVYTFVCSDTDLYGSHTIPCKIDSYQGTGTGRKLLRTEAYSGADQFPGPASVTTTLEDGSSSTTQWQWNSGSPQAYFPTHLTQEKVLDFGGTLLRERDQSFLTTTPYQSAFITGKLHQLSVYDGSHVLRAQTTYGYDETTLSEIKGVPGHDDQRAGVGKTIRGNLTSITKIIDPNTTTKSQLSYNTLGNLSTITDSRLNVTSIDYADKWYASSCPTVSTYIFPSKVTNALGQVTQTGYWCNGFVAQVKDPNDVASNRDGTVTTYDVMGNVSLVTYADRGSWATDHHSYSNPPQSTETVQSSGGPIVTSTFFDGMGRVNRTELASDPGGAIYVDTTYNGAGQVASVSNPYRSGDVGYGTTSYVYDALGRKTRQAQADGTSALLWNYTANIALFTDENGSQWERTTDALGRLFKVREPNGTSKSPSMETDYSYDALDNLIGVVQWGGPKNSGTGSRTRMFSYDSVSRLLASNNPEEASSLYPAGLSCAGATGVWTHCYSYDANGNLSKRWDNRNISTTYSYDVLNRLTGKTYSDSTPSVFYLYDQPHWTYVAETSPADPPGTPTTQANVVGRLSVEGTHSPNGATLAAAAFSYDPMGRIAIESTCTPRTCASNGFAGNISDQYDMHYTYDLAGNMTFAGRGLLSRKNNATPNAGYYYGGLAYTIKGDRQVSLATSDLAVDATHPHRDIASSLAYSPLGGVTNVTLGEEFGQTISYSPRGWITKITSLDFNGNQTLLDTSGHDLAGNLTSSFDSNLGTFSYCYDTLSRLTNFAGGSPCTITSTAGLTYGYDAFGNLDSRAATGGASTYQFSFVANSNNQDSSRSYDASGHLLSDGVHTYTYDAEGRINTVDNGIKYYYDAQGVRFAEGAVGQTPTTDFLYDLDGHLITTVGADYRLIRTNLYVAGHHWADYTAGTGTGGGRTEYRLADQVGTFIYKFDQTAIASKNALPGRSERISAAVSPLTSQRHTSLTRSEIQSRTWTT